jgi:signal transduction histidine kinase
MGGAELDLLLRQWQPASLPGPVKACVDAAAAGGTAALIDVVALDPVLSLGVLGPGQATPRDAATTLDADLLLADVLAMPVTSGELLDTPSLDWPGLWLHCIAVGQATRWLADRAQLPIEPEEAFAAGLLHDVGKIALAQMMPRSWARAAAAAAEGELSLIELEQRVLGVDHATAGRRIAETRGWSGSVIQAIWLHHQPPAALPHSLSDAPLVVAVALADQAVRTALPGWGGNRCSSVRSDQLERSLGVAEGTCDELAATVESLLDAPRKLLRLDAPQQPMLEGLAESRACQLAQVARRAARRCRPDRSVEMLERFWQGLSPRAGVADVLERLAAVVAAEAGPVVAYALGGESGTALALRHAPGAKPKWRTLSPGRDATERPAAATGELAAALNWPGDELAEWIDLAQARHVPLECDGRWVGGFVVTATAEGDWPKAFTATAAMAVAGSQALADAAELGEQLAGASQSLAQTQQALAQAGALAIIGEMAAGAAHEMNTPLAVISGRAQLMRERAKDEKQRRVWQTIVDQAHRVSDIITDLMEFASPRPPQVRPLDGRDLLAEARERFLNSDHPQAGNSQVDIDTATRQVQALADREQLLAVLSELLANAAAASGPEPRITLGAKADELAGGVLLTVDDRGTGMDEATADQAFTPFFSLQKAGRRRGLGLARARRLVELNAGRIWLRSRPGEGTTVTVRLPVAGDSDDRQENEPHPGDR